MNLRDSMMLYGVTLGKRRSKRQRYRFLQQIEEVAVKNGYTIQVQTPGKGSGSLKAENIVLGDVTRAKTIFAVPFDTPTRALIPCRYFPFHPELTVKDEHRDMLVQGLVGVLLLAGTYPAITLALTKRGIGFLWLIPAAALVGLALGFFRGWTNPVNFNRSSASVAVAARLCERLKGRKDVAFVFCDKAATSYDGYKTLAKELPDNARVVVLDCIAKGDELVLAHGSQANLRAQKLMELLPEGTKERVYDDESMGRNLLAVFPAGMILTGGSIENGELVVRNTRSPRDMGLDLSRLEKIEGALVDFIVK